MNTPTKLTLGLSLVGLTIIGIAGMGVHEHYNPNTVVSGKGNQPNFKGFAPVIDTLGSEGGYQELATPTPTTIPKNTGRVIVDMQGNRHYDNGSTNYQQPTSTPIPRTENLQDNFTQPPQREQNFTNPAQNCPGGVLIIDGQRVCRQKQNNSLPSLYDVMDPEENAGLTPEEIWAGLTLEQQKYFWDLYAISWQQEQENLREHNKSSYSDPKGFYVDGNGDIASWNNEILNQVQDYEEQTQQVVTWELDSQTYASLI